MLFTLILLLRVYDIRLRGVLVGIDNSRFRLVIVPIRNPFCYVLYLRYPMSSLVIAEAKRPGEVSPGQS